MATNQPSDENPKTQDHEAGNDTSGAGISAKRLEANRRNAQKSTGPRTPSGKARSSRNARRHGMLSIAPFIAGIESRRAWQEHRDALFKSIALVGYLEEVLTTLVAILIWKLWRSFRHEAKFPAASIAAAEQDLDSSEVGEGKPEDPAAVRAKAEERSLIAQFLEGLPTMADEKLLPKQLAQDALSYLFQVLPNSPDKPIVREVPTDDHAYKAFDKWTVGLFRSGLQAYAAAARVSPDDLRRTCICFIHKTVEEDEDNERELIERRELWELGLERERIRRILLEPNVLDAITRSQNSLERSVYKTLHEIQRFQAVRRGTPVNPPEVLEVDLTIPNGPSRRY